MIKAIYIKNNNDSLIETNIDNIPKILEQKPKLVWVDITLENNENSIEEIAFLADSFKFDDLSIEDCLFPQYHPKIEEFENYVFVAIHGIKGKIQDFSDFENSIYELDLFLGKDYIVTVHTEELLIMETLFKKAKTNTQAIMRSTEILLYNIFQKVVSSFELTIEKINESFDELEDRVLENPSTELLNEIFAAKKKILNIRKIAEPQQNVYSYFSIERTGFISKKNTAYFRDIFFQYDRISQTILSQGQIISSILEIYISGTTQKLNEVMKFLTIIATILMPAILVASYYGMNVSFPEHKVLGADKAWYFAVFIIIVFTIGVYYYIKKKKWF